MAFNKNLSQLGAITSQLSRVMNVKRFRFNILDITICVWEDTFPDPFWLNPLITAGLQPWQFVRPETRRPPWRYVFALILRVNFPSRESDTWNRYSHEHGSPYILSWRSLTPPPSPAISHTLSLSHFRCHSLFLSRDNPHFILIKTNNAIPDHFVTLGNKLYPIAPPRYFPIVHVQCDSRLTRARNIKELFARVRKVWVCSQKNIEMNIELTSCEWSQEKNSSRSWGGRTGNVASFCILKSSLLEKEITDLPKYRTIQRSLTL